MQENSPKYKTDDIRKILVEKLSSDEELVIRNLPDKNYIWTLKRNGVKEEVYFSSSVKDVTGYSPKEYFELPGNGVELVEKTDLPEYKKQLAKLEDEEANEIEITYRIKTKEREIKWIKEQIRKEFKDNLQIFYGFVTDVTDYKEREDKLEKISNDLKQLNIAKDNFISILSHDLRAPFTSILGFSEILKNENSLSEDEKIEYLNYIHGSSENQLQLINYLLDWSRLQTGRMKMEITRVHVPLVVFNCVSSLTGNAVRKNIDIKVDVENSIYVEADERLLSQIVTNLLSNAIKFSPNGKNIEIRVSVFNDDFIEFTIKDEGIGIPEKHKDKLFRFDKMFTTEGTRGEKGTGLGLPLVKEIIEKHKGQIWFYSQENNGSEFHFTIPNATSTILLVENNIEERMLFENIIRDKYPTFRVVSTDNGYDAINLVYMQHPALIIASHEMPLMSGIQFIRSLKRKDKNFNTPVIALLETQNENIEKTYQEFGVRQVISKPVDLRIFNETLSELLNQNKFNL